MTEMNQTHDILASVRQQLTKIDELPISEHAAHLEGVHRKLESELSTIDGL